MLDYGVPFMVSLFVIHHSSIHNSSFKPYTLTFEARGRRQVHVDTLNQVVLRETAHTITSRTPPLKPGEKRAFRVSFDHMPADWNQAPPTITVKYLGF